jgi:hypothetical protein
MDSRYRKKAWIGLGISLPLFLGGWALIFTYVRGAEAERYMTTPPALLAYAMLAVSIPFYLWGCAALAKAKGYSGAIVLTCLLGWLFPVVVLLALPDKNKHYRRRW